MYYRRLSALFILAVAPLSYLATPIELWADLQVKHTWSAVPDNWESLGHPPADTIIDLHIALKPHREGALIDALYEVSDPRHPKYGAHLSREQVAELVAPHPDTLELVTSWLEHGGVSSPISMTHGGGWLTVTDVPIFQANDLLGASYQLYRHTGTNDTIIRTVGYALPAVLHAHVQTVAPTTYFSLPHTPQQAPHKRPREEAAAKAKSGELVSGRDVTEEVTLELLRWLYGTQTYVPVSTDRNVLGIAGHLGESPSQDDLTLFMKVYRTEAEDATFKVVKVNGGKYDPSHATLEASQNIQYAEGIAYPTPHIFYSIGGDNGWYPDTKLPMPRDSDLVWIKSLLRKSKIPQTISISYGNPERIYPVEYATAICDLFAQLGLRGTSVLVASGDHGVGNDDADCKNKSNNVRFMPLFPASCPWVTSVGGTTSFEPEEGASISGGGFSFHFPRPDYQIENGEVDAFLHQLGTDQYAGYFRRDGRGIPDISAQALNFQVVMNPNLVTMIGTSCSAPTVAGVISLLNDHLLASGKDPLGFLNPWLYGKGRAGLTDILTGSNPGCKTEGFFAIEGWDPVTGLGTPLFETMQQTLADRPVVSSIAVATSSPTPSARTWLSDDS